MRYLLALSILVFVSGCGALQGDPGIQVPGPQGIAGEKGEPGPAGPQGPPGDGSAGASGSRLHRQYFAGDDGSQSPIGLYDTQLMTACAFELAGDGETRCLPLGLDVTFDMKYLDSGCTEAVIAWGSLCPPKEFFRSLVLDPHPACAPYLTNIYRLDPTPTAPTTVYDLACVPQPAGGDAFYALTKLDPSSFQRGASATE